MKPVLLAKETFDIFYPALPDTLGDLPGEAFLQKFLTTGIKFGFFAGTIAFFFIFALGAIKWLSAGGDMAQL